MSPRFVLAVVVGLVCGTLDAADGDRRLIVIPSRSTPVIESVAVYRTKDGKRESVGELKAFDKPLTLPDDGPFEILAKPKGGLAISVADKVSVKPGQKYELKLENLIGTVEVFGDNFPRADRIVVTDERDPGPGEKGHRAIQSAGDYRVEMAVPPGYYAVWVVPANGAKAQRVADRIRVMAGRSVRVGD